MRRMLTFLFCLIAFVPRLAAQEKSVNPGINKQYEGDVDADKYVKSFEVEGREAFARRKEIVAAMQLKPGMIVADVGAGTGLFTRLFAEAVGPKGTVYATDIQANFLEHILKTSHEAGLNNVKTVLSTADSSGLPPNSCDVVYVSDVYHHFEFPKKTMATIHKALRPGGKFVIVDYKRVAGRSSDFIYHHLRAGREVFEAEIKSFGFKLIDEPLFLRDNYMLRFEPFEVPELPNDISVWETIPWRIECSKTGWALTDMRSGVRWPTNGWARVTTEASPPQSPPVSMDIIKKAAYIAGIRIHQGQSSIEISNDLDTLACTYNATPDKDIRVLTDFLAITEADRGGIVVPCREGLWFPSDGKHDFKHVFGSAEYEGCHMNMLGIIKNGSALIVSWNDAYITPEIEKTHSNLTTTLDLPRSARTIRLAPLGSGDINTLAVGYRKLGEKQADIETLKKGVIGAGGYSKTLDSAAIGAQVIPFWEMIYHDRQIRYGKYDYEPREAAELVDLHLLAARSLDNHPIPDPPDLKQSIDKAIPKDPAACFTRTDNGWAAGKPPAEAFLKNTQEFLGPLNAATANQRLERLDFLTADGLVRRATYGQDREMTTVVVNLGATDVQLSLDEGDVVLPQYGFSIYGPKITAFYARKWGGIDFPEGALFAVTPMGGKPFGKASEMRVYHGFGEQSLRLYGTRYVVAREQVVSIKRRGR